MTAQGLTRRIEQVENALNPPETNGYFITFPAPPSWSRERVDEMNAENRRRGILVGWHHPDDEPDPNQTRIINLSFDDV